MHTVVYALAQHDDIAKFELEDGLVRRAAVELLAAPSSISSIVVHIPRAEEVRFDVATRPPGYDALLEISAGDERDTKPKEFDELTVDVALPIGAWSVSTVQIADRSDSWIGTATPGITLTILFTRAPGIDRNSYDGWLRDALKSCVERLDDVAVRQLSPLTALLPGDDFETMLEFSFPSASALAQAVADQAFTPVIGSELLDPTSIRSQSSVKHRLVPNENAWEMHNTSHPTGE
jgi:hypothetical protein